MADNSPQKALKLLSRIRSDGTRQIDMSPALAAEGMMLDKKMYRIGDRLVEQGLISIDQLNVALHEKKNTGKMLGQILVELGFISEAIPSGFLSENHRFQQHDQKKTMLDPEALALMNKMSSNTRPCLYRLIVRNYSSGLRWWTLMTSWRSILKAVMPRGFEIVLCLRGLRPRGCGVHSLRRVDVD